MSNKNKEKPLSEVVNINWKYLLPLVTDLIMGGVGFFLFIRRYIS